MDHHVLIFGETQLDHPLLQLPHPRINERPFVYLPLREILPDA